MIQIQKREPGRRALRVRREAMARPQEAGRRVQDRGLGLARLAQRRARQVRGREQLLRAVDRHLPSGYARAALQGPLRGHVARRQLPLPERRMKLTKKPCPRCASLARERRIRADSHPGGDRRSRRQARRRSGGLLQGVLLRESRVEPPPCDHPSDQTRIRGTETMNWFCCEICWMNPTCGNDCGSCEGTPPLGDSEIEPLAPSAGTELQQGSGGGKERGPQEERIERG